MDLMTTKELMINIYNNDYEELLNHSLTSFGGSLFSQIVDRCLGQYIANFTKIEYILNYQPIFVGAAFTLLKITVFYVNNNC